MTQLWITHRPDKLSDMVGLEELKLDVPNWVIYEQNKHNLRCGGVIFFGSSGTGKSSGARAIGMDLLGDSFSQNFHPFNASDDRGIQFIRNRLKPLAEQRAVGHDFKIIFLDEADGLTNDAQDALREIIESTGTHVLWILACNRIGRIIPALRSRLPAYNFTPLNGDDAEGFILRIIEQEDLPQEWLDSVPQLVKKYKGDMRACLKLLQTLNPKDADALSRSVEKDTDGIRSLYSAIAGGGELIELSSDLVIQQGYSRDDIIDGMHDAIIHHYNEGDVGQAVALKHLMILGQWAARSSDWLSSDVLFLQSMVGDYRQRGF